MEAIEQMREKQKIEAEIGRLNKVAEKLPVGDSMRKALEERASMLTKQLKKAAG